MANGAGRLFDIIKDTSEGMQPTQAQYVTLTVKSLNPLIFNKDDRLDITREFCIFDTTFDFSTIHINDIIGAILLNNGQLYYICVNLSLDKTVAERLNETQIVDGYSASTTDGYSANYLNNNFLKIFTVNFRIGIFGPNVDKYNQVYSIPTNIISTDYKPIGITGFQLYGSYYSHCLISGLYLSDRNINYACKNTSDMTTGDIYANIYILAIKIN